MASGYIQVKLGGICSSHCVQLLNYCPLVVIKGIDQPLSADRGFINLEPDAHICRFGFSVYVYCYILLIFMQSTRHLNNELNQKLCRLLPQKSPPKSHSSSD